MSALTRKTEVTKLITVTLGKIQQSKQAKCGLNLRKSLLVASVLHKARNIYVTEVKSRSITNENELSSTSTDSTPAKVKRFSSHRSMSVIEEEEPSTCTRPVQEAEVSSTVGATQSHTYTQLTVVPDSSKDLLPITCSATKPEETGHTKPIDDILTDLVNASESGNTTTDKENNPPALKQLPVTSCGQCLKRRATTDYAESDGDNESTESYQAPLYTNLKRPRSHSCSETTLIEDTCKPVPMDTTQINYLVNIFSQSFSELSPTDSHEVGSNYETSTEMNTFALCRDSIALTV